MNAKHLTKNAISHKLVFLAAAIVIALIVAFSICATNEAKAVSVNHDSKLNGQVSIKNALVDEGIDLQLYYSS